MALSRCKSLDSVRVINWQKKCVIVSKEVVRFYQLNQSYEDCDTVENRAK